MKQIVEQLDAILAQPEIDLAAIADSGVVDDLRTRYQQSLAQARRLRSLVGLAAAPFDEQNAHATLGLAFAHSAQALVLLAHLPCSYCSGTDNSAQGQARSNAYLALTRFEATSKKLIDVVLNAMYMPVVCYLEAQSRSAFMWSQAAKALLDAGKFDTETLLPAVDQMRRSVRPA